jgi:hypothetical protein
MSIRGIFRSKSEKIIQNGLKQADALPPLLFNLTLGYDIKKVKEN